MTDDTARPSAGSSPEAMTIQDPGHGRTRAPGPRPELGAIPLEAVVDQVGRFLLIEEVGRGGMGMVMRAYDPRLHREVALKVVTAPPDRARHMTRMVEEARAMARVSDPNVVSVYDVDDLGEQGVVIVMEYVAGRTLRAWRARRQLGWRDVLQVFIAAGRGLAAAHEAGLLHRDFKPANVLVSQGGLVVKVTDFGLAQASDLGSSSKGWESSREDDDEDAGAIMAGTPRYMAPEQHRGQVLCAAADQYAFCVALWEALCGGPPFRGARLSFDKEQGPPAWPNSAVPRRVTEAIVRGLSPDPAARWQDMRALLGELSRACVRRRRRRWLALAGVTVVIMAALSLTGPGSAQQCSGGPAQLQGVWDQPRREQIGRALEATGVAYGKDARDRTLAALDDYSADWIDTYREACEATARGTQAGGVMDARMGCLRRAKVQLAATADVLSDADPRVASKTDALVAGLPALQRCREPVPQSHGSGSPLPAEAASVSRVRALVSRAGAERLAGRLAAAQSAIEAARRESSRLRYGPVHSEVSLEAGSIWNRLGRYVESEASLRRSLQLALRWGQRDQIGAASRKLMFVVGARQRRPDEALCYLPLGRAMARGNPKSEASVRSIAAEVHLAQGDLSLAVREQQRALASYQRVAPSDPLMVARLRGRLANALSAQGRHAEAEQQHRHVLALRLEALGASHPDVARSHNNAANALDGQGKYAQAELEHRRVLELRKQILGSSHPDVAQSHNNLANALYAQRRFERAEDHYRSAAAIWEVALGPGHPDVAAALNNLAVVLRRQEKYAQAEFEQRRALELQEAVLGREHPEVAVSRSNLAVLLRSQGHLAAAEVEQRKAIALLEAALGPTHPTVMSARQSLAWLLLEAGRAPEARQIAEVVWRIRQDPSTPAVARANTAFVLARALWETAQDGATRHRAKVIARDAHDTFSEAGDEFAEPASDVLAWLEHR